MAAVLELLAEVDRLEVDFLLDEAAEVVEAPEDCGPEYEGAAGVPEVADLAVEADEGAAAALLAEEECLGGGC